MKVNKNKEKISNTRRGGHSSKADQIHEVLMEFGVNFVSGVPCGVLRQIIENFEVEERVLHLPANRESEAVGLAVGAYLGKRTPVVYMQNSGLFSSSNDIASLVIPYKIPILFIVSYRGCPGEDAIQHLATGQATETLIRSLGLPFLILDSKKEIKTQIRSVLEDMSRKKLPSFLLLKRGWQDEHE